MKLAVIVSNCEAHVCVGGEVERRVHLFDMPPAIADLISQMNLGQYSSVSLAVVVESKSTAASLADSRGDSQGGAG